MSRERELLERLLSNWERPVTGRFGDLFDEVRDFLYTPEPTQDEEPTESYDTIDVMRAACPYHSNELRGAFYDGWMQREKLHPAQRPEFVRLSEEEVSEILTSAHTPYEAICAVENRLVEKNK